MTRKRMSSTSEGMRPSFGEIEHGRCTQVHPDGDHCNDKDRAARTSFAEANGSPEDQRQRRVKKRRQKSARDRSRAYMKCNRAGRDETHGQNETFRFAAGHEAPSLRMR